MDDPDRHEEAMSTDKEKNVESVEEESIKAKMDCTPDAVAEKTESQDSDKTEEEDSNAKNGEGMDVDETKLEKKHEDSKTEDNNDEEKKSEKEKETKDEKEDEDMTEESEGEEEEDVVVLEDIEDDGEDPSEVELEKFNQPFEHQVLQELSEMRTKRKVVCYPVKMSELSHPSLLEAIGKSSEFRTCFIQKVDGDKPDAVVWAGCVEINFRSTITAADMTQSLKSIREDLTVRCVDIGEHPVNMTETLGGSDNADTTQKIIDSVLITKGVPEEASVDSLRTLFTGCSDIVMPQQKQEKRMAYVIYENAAAVEEACKQFAASPPEIEEKKLRVFKYQPNADMPKGLMRMKRRYRVLLQISMLRKAIKDKNANHTKNVKNMMSSTIKHCKSLIEKDDEVRKELALSVFSLAELRRYKRIREAVKEDTIWLPGRKMHQPRFLDDEDDEDRQRRLARSLHAADKTETGIPSLMSVTLDPKFAPQMVRAQQIAQTLARLAPMVPPVGPTSSAPSHMRGGPGGPRGMMRGGHGMRGGPGGFGGHGGFHDGPPPMDDFEYDSSFRGRRGGGYGRGFGDSGYGRGGFGRGGDSGGYGGRGRDSSFGDRGGFGRDSGFGNRSGYGGSRGGGYERGGYNKRPRSPPSGSRGGYRGSSEDKGDDHSSKMPRKDSDDNRWSSSRQDSGSRGGGRGGRGGYRQGQDSGWKRSQGDHSSGGYGKGGYSGGSDGGSGTYTQQQTTSAPDSYNQSTQSQGGNYPQAGGYNQQSTTTNTPAMAAYGQTGAGYGQQGYDQNAANMASYNQATAAGYGQAYGQAGYGQTTAAGYGQTQDPNAAAAAAAYAGYSQASADYYQTAAAAAAGYQSGMVSYPGYQTGTTSQATSGAAATATQSWGMMGQQQYWTGGDQTQTQAQTATSWPTGAEGTTAATDPNAAAAYGYNWAAAAGGWKQ